VKVGVLVPSLFGPNEEYEEIEKLRIERGTVKGFKLIFFQRGVL
jgi:hypothetical protein